MILCKHILSIFEAEFVKNLSIFEPQIEKHYVYTKTHVSTKTALAIWNYLWFCDFSKLHVTVKYTEQLQSNFKTAGDNISAAGHLTRKD